MDLTILLVAGLLIGSVAAQDYKVCIPSTETGLCQSLNQAGSQVACESIETRIDCAVKLRRRGADIGVFSEEEMVLLSHHQPSDNRVIASIRDVSRTESFAFEAVVVVPARHTGGLEGLRGAAYCHPGFDQSDLRWSARVLKTLERTAARTDRCPGLSTSGRTAEEIEVETLAQFFGNACRPGPWSANSNIDANLKSRFPSLCSLCGANSDCSSYTIDMGSPVTGVDNNNRHIQSLECLRSSTTSGGNGVAYVAWQYVRQFFNIRNPNIASSFALLCEDGSLRVLSSSVLAPGTAPCSFVKQPWGAIVGTATRASAIQTSLRTWWPNGANPGGNTWQSTLFGAIVGGSNARVVFEDNLPTPLQYTQAVQNFTSIDAASSCLPVHRWCALSYQELLKCQWIRNAAYVMGIEPLISCQVRNNIIGCLSELKSGNADFLAISANHGFLARQQYQLTSVKLVQNSRTNPNSFSRVAALVKDGASISSFQDLRGKRACFPEFGAIPFMAFARAARELGVISTSQCDYARALGEFFGSACVPGALFGLNIRPGSTFNATTLCTVCRPSVPIDFTCASDNLNLYNGNRGSIMCLANPDNDVAFVELRDIDQHLSSANLPASSVRALCRNNRLSASTGVAIDQDCLLAYTVDSEVLARRNDPITNSVSALLDTLDYYFGYNIGASSQLINLKLYSSFDSIKDLLFLDTVIGLSEPSGDASNEAARNYNELFQHLESCTGSDNLHKSVGGYANRNLVPILKLITSSLLTYYIIY